MIYRTNPQITSAELKELFSLVWDAHQPRDFTPILKRSLVFVCAYMDGLLVGFANVAWDGGVHAFLLDTMVRPDLRRQGICRQLVRHAAEETAKKRGMEWLHVDYEPHLEGFYEACGFRPSQAGLMNVGNARDD